MPQRDNRVMNLTHIDNVRLFRLARASVAALQKCNGQRTDCCCCYDPTNPVVSLQSCIDAATDTADANKKCSQNAADTLNKNKDVDATLFAPPVFCFDLCLLEYPVHTIRANSMQTLNAGYWN